MVVQTVSGIILPLNTKTNLFTCMYHWKILILSAKYNEIGSILMVHEQFTRLLWVALWHLHTQILCHFAKTSMNNIVDTL